MDRQLEELLRECRQRLSDAVSDRSHSWRTPTMSTVRPNAVPDGRVMILRAVEADASRVELHTDARSRKLEDLKERPGCALTFWSEKRQLQLRARGRGERAERGDEVHLWKRVPESARALYTTEPAPGTPLVEPAAFTYGEAHFAVIRIHIEVMDILDLSTTPHHRLMATKTHSGWQGEWVVP
jgi:3-hydroxyisobutyrate dehydrogenase